MRPITRFYRDEFGATAIEYVMLASIVAVVAIGAMTAFGAAVTGKFSFIATSVTGVGS